MQSIYPPAAIGFGVPGAFIVATEGWVTALLALGISFALLAVLLAARGWWLSNHHTNEPADVPEKAPMNTLARRIRRALFTDRFVKTYIAISTTLAVLVIVMDPRWWWLLIPTALYALTALTIHIVLAVQRANAKTGQILREELDPDPFAERVRPVRDEPTGETR